MKRSIINFKFMNTPAAIGAVVGLIIGGLFGHSAISSLQSSSLNTGLMIGGFGNQWAVWLTAINTIGGAAIGFSIVRILATRFSQLNHGDTKTDAIKSYTMPDWVTPRTSFSITLGEDHGGENYVLNPQWARVPERGLFGNVVVFGGIGSGKTASVANPIMRQILEFKPTDRHYKMGGLVLDVKGDFAAFVRECGEQYHRTNDIISVSPDTEFRWNPIHDPATLPETIAGRLLAVYQNITQDSGAGENAWVSQGVLKLLSNTIGILRECRGYITITDCNFFINEISDGEIESIERIIKRVVLPNSDAENSDRFKHHMRYFNHEWVNESDRSRGIIISAAKNTTGLFTIPEAKKTFSPTVDEITFNGFDTVIDDGKIVVLDMPDSQFGILSTAVGTLLKLAFQRAALARVARAKRDTKTNVVRNLFFVCDEYQKFATVSGAAGEGDEQFYALSRQSRCINLVLTQSPVSLVAKLGDEAARVMFASLRTKLYLSLSDSIDAETAAKTMGEDWQDVENIAFSETVQNAGHNPIDQSITGTNANVSETRQLQQTRRYIIEPIRLMHLRTFECYGSIFDGIKQLPAKKILLKPDFIPVQLQPQYINPRAVPFVELMDVIDGGTDD